MHLPLLISLPNDNNSRNVQNNDVHPKMKEETLLLLLLLFYRTRSLYDVAR